MPKSAPARAAAAERLEARVPPEQKVFFQHAAELKGQSLTDFMIGALQDAAVKTVEEYNLIRLTVADRQVFVDTLMNPPAPNQALQRAAKRYRRSVTP